MTDEQSDRQESALSSVIEDVVSSMSRKQFDALAERTGHTPVDPKEEAAQALSDLIKHGNLAADQLTTAQIANRLVRRGRRP